MRVRFRLAAPVALAAAVVLALSVTSASSVAQEPGPDCSGLPNHAELKEAVTTTFEEGGNGGLGFNMWATVVNRDGVVCNVAFSGADRGDQWPGSRIISAQKAYAANAFSQPTDGPGGGPAGLFQGLSLSTANLFSAVQPGGSLYGLSDSNPVDGTTAYAGDHAAAGQPDDPLVGQKVGGINTFGGGLALYTADGELIGGLGVSGDTSCTDHNFSWKMRDGFELDNIRTGILPNLVGGDNIIYDRVSESPLPSPSGFGHPQCIPPGTVESVLLPVTHPLGGGLALPLDKVEKLREEIPKDPKARVPQLDTLLDRVGINLPVRGR